MLKASAWVMNNKKEKKLSPSSKYSQISKVFQILLQQQLDKSLTYQKLWKKDIGGEGMGLALL